MSTQVDARSIEAIRDFRAALAIYAEEALAALGSAKMEARRTLHWVQHDRRDYWVDQVKRRRERVASARSEVARRRLQKTADSSPAMSEQKELLRHAEAALREAEAKVVLLRKWEPALRQAILEADAGTRRIADLAGGGVPRAIHLLTRLLDALDAYLREAPPALAATLDRPDFDALAAPVLHADEAAVINEGAGAEAEAGAGGAGEGGAGSAWLDPAGPDRGGS